MRSSAGRPSPALWIDETSLPTLERRYLLAGDRVAKDVADVESCEPAADPDVPVAEEEEPRLKGLAAGNGMSTGADCVDDARRFCDAMRLVVDIGGMLEVDAASGDLGATCSDGERSAGGGGTGLAALLAVCELPPELTSPSLAALESPVLVLTRRFDELWLESRRGVVDEASPAFLLVLRLRGSDDGAVVDETRDTRGELRPSSLASAAAVPSFEAAACSMSTSTPSSSRVCRRMDAATIDGDEWCEWNECRESRAWSGVRPGVVVDGATGGGCCEAGEDGKLARGGTAGTLPLSSCAAKTCEALDAAGDGGRCANVPLPADCLLACLALVLPSTDMPRAALLLAPATDALLPPDTRLECSVGEAMSWSKPRPTMSPSAAA